MSIEHELKKRSANEFPPVFLGSLGVLLLCFSPVLFSLVSFSWKSSSYSYILLVPVISVYLIRSFAPPFRGNFEPHKTGGILAAGLGCVLMACYFVFLSRRPFEDQADKLFVPTLAFLVLFYSLVLLILGWEYAKSRAFALGLLVFMLPIPSGALTSIKVFLQHTSASAAEGLFIITGTPYLKSGLIFQLPGIAIRVAEECSGVNSSLVLFLVSLIAGYMFLKNNWLRAAIAIFVIPLGIIRNGFRILTISLLCVHVDPSYIDSYIHHKGGPIFFALSLGPLLALLLSFRAYEEKRARKARNLSKSSPPEIPVSKF